MSLRPSSDAGIVSQLIGLHYSQAPSLLDATWGGGRMWRGCRYQPTTRSDARALPGVDVVGRWTDLPTLFAPGAFQVVVWDPPHQTDGGATALRGKDWVEAYGTADLELRGRLNINHLYPEILGAARAILQPDVGTLLCKIADQAHGGLQHLQAVDLVVAARRAGWYVCEMMPKMRQAGPMDPRWRRQYHVRKAWSYWICAHPGPRCPAVGVPLVRACEVCGRDFPAKRRDARTCGDACRKRRQRRRTVTDIRCGAQQLSVT